MGTTIAESLFTGWMDPVNWLLVIIGVAGGILVGALPGLTATMALALMLPFTFTMGPEAALILLGAIYIGAIYGGSISAILINTPGTPSSIATTFDGFPLTQKGRAEQALVTAAFSSGVGGVLGGISLLFLSPLLADLALSFGPPEFFWVAVFGLTVIATLSSGSIVKGLTGGAFGLLLSTVGIAPVGGDSRFTFGFSPLQGGLDLVVVLIGLFCIPEVIAIIERRKLQDHLSYQPVKGVAGKVIKRLIRRPFLFLRSSVIGIVTGIIPGAGGNVASLLAYDATVRFDKNKEEYGTGKIEGVAASESGNNAEVGGSLVPLLSLGIPGAAPAAVLMGALLIQGITPGPDLYKNYPDLVHTFVGAFIAANVVMFVMAFYGARYVARLLNLPSHTLVPLIMMLTVIGSYAIRNNLLDVAMMVGFGIMGYLLKKVGFEPGPIVLGLILGSIAETGLVQSMLIGQAKGGIWMVFLNRPITLLLIGFCLISLGSSWWMLRSGRRDRREKKGVEGRNGGDLWVSLGFILVAVIALGHLRGLNKMSAIFPGTVGGILFFLGVVCLFQSLFGRGKSAEKGVAPVLSVWVVSLGMAGYVALIPWLGFLAATLLFAGTVTWFLSQRERNFRGVAVSLLIGLLFYAVFRWIFMVPFPEGWLL